MEYANGRLTLQPAPIDTAIRETYDRCHEDIIVEALLRVKFSTAGRGMSTVRYLEVGSNHPVQTSATYFFHRAWEVGTKSMAHAMNLPGALDPSAGAM